MCIISFSHTLLHSTCKINGQNRWSTIYWNDVLTFPTGDVGVYDDLGSVEEVPKLGLPYNQVVWVVDAHAILEPQHCLLRQGAVSQLKAGEANTCLNFVMQGTLLYIQQRNLCTGIHVHLPYYIGEIWLSSCILLKSKTFNCFYFFDH